MMMRWRCEPWRCQFCFDLVNIQFPHQTDSMKNEFVFQVEQDEDMLVAVCHKPEMATQAANLDELIAMIQDLIQCRFGAGPSVKS